MPMKRLAEIFVAQIITRYIPTLEMYLQKSLINSLKKKYET